MHEKLIFFSQTEGNLLIRLLLAHIAADFMFQTTKMVSEKDWFSKSMLVHIGVVFTLTFIFGGNPFLAITIAILHWLVDGAKITAQRTKPSGKEIPEIVLFLVDQLVHIITIILIWCASEGLYSAYLHRINALYRAFQMPFVNYKISLILLGYAFVTTPVGYLIKLATLDMNSSNRVNIQHGGKLIGIFERIIILTLVLLGQYSAIGFLITGKSIIRFINDDEHLRSEYVLVGTMMSYAFAIIIGAVINWLLAL